MNGKVLLQQILWIQYVVYQYAHLVIVVSISAEHSEARMLQYFHQEKSSIFPQKFEKSSIFAKNLKIHQCHFSVTTLLWQSDTIVAK